MKKVLIANRGEIAVRIIRACRELDLKTVAIYSDVDAGSAHVLLADEAYCLGEAEASKSYLNLEKLKKVIQASKCDAIHPGFGFYAENADFARLCASLGVTFIGPTPETIECLGDKVKARALMQKAGVPIVPGSDGPVTSVETAKKVAAKVGYPMLIKAAAGGGGKGMRLVQNDKELEQGFVNTQREALNYFGNDEVFLERFVQNPHHIEVQLIGDTHGNVAHLFERECSLQRRHQKVVEEAPAPLLIGQDKVREKLFEVAVQGAKSVGYVNAGTMEFIMDEEFNFYFLEMNTRIQVEHPVTEWITGTDIVKEQIRVAQGEKLAPEFMQAKLQGHSIECRLYAEDPHSFLPKPGRVADTWLPGGPGVRVDSALMNGQTIPIEYDPMIAKISTHGRDRKEAVQRMRRALSEVLVAGTVTNLSFLRKTLDHKVFQKGIYTTNFIQEAKELTDLAELPSGIATEEELHALLSVVALHDFDQRKFQSTEPANWMQNER